MSPGRAILLVAVIAAAGVAATRWPRINEVETGRTPEYPDLREREFSAPEAVVSRAAKAAIASLPGWSLVGAGQGPGGTAIQALATKTDLAKTEMTIGIRRQGSKTLLRVKARSTYGPWDFGQGARHIHDFLDALDREMAAPSPKR